MNILVAMSGGVDSSVAAKQLVEAGHRCVGCTMKLYANEDAGVSGEHTCCSVDDVEDARSVANRLGMPYYVFNFSDNFRQKVIDKFVNSYLQGITPNPCIDCNRYMKFDKLFERADLLSCDYVATGHYARITCRDGQYFLHKATDPTKDQSYVLYTMTQAQLARTLFPLGELCKSDTRRLAEEGGFINAQKPDSQDICFVPNGDYAAVIEQHLGHPAEPGRFVNAAGEVLGTHRGLIRYTVGQHRGLGLGVAQKQYVCRLCPQDNTVVLGSEADLFSREAVAGEFNWIAGTPPTAPVYCKVKLRYRHPEQPATVTVRPDGTVAIVFDEPQRAITPGQAAVLYDGDTVLGGGRVLANP